MCGLPTTDTQKLTTIVATSNQHAIYVTKPFLPPLDEFYTGLEEVWSNGMLTNSGPIHQRLRHLLCDMFGTENVSLYCNGTLALQIGLQALGLSGEVITTPVYVCGNGTRSALKQPSAGFCRY